MASKNEQKKNTRRYHLNPAIAPYSDTRLGSIKSAWATLQARGGSKKHALDLKIVSTQACLISGMQEMDLYDIECPEHEPAGVPTTRPGPANKHA
jgi:hypothetical protein